MSRIKPKKDYEVLSEEDKRIFSWLHLSGSYSLGYKMRFPISFPDKDIDYYLKMLKGDIEEQQKIKPLLKSIPEKSITVLLTSTGLGKGDRVYSEGLLHKFIFALTKVSVKPKMIIFTNEAVLLMQEGSPVLDSLKILEKQEVQIYGSNSCAEFYKCSEKINTGKLIDIYEICDYLINASKVITI